MPVESNEKAQKKSEKIKEDPKKGSVYFMKHAVEKPEFPLTLSEDEIFKFDKIRNNLQEFLLKYPNNFMQFNYTANDLLEGKP